MENELIKIWRKNGFTLRLYDSGITNSHGRSVLSYVLRDGKKVIFVGIDFSCSPLYADDSLESVAALLGFLTLKPGDTDREYFNNYSKDQMDWCESSRCEELNMIQFEMEERLSRKKRN